jgi:predicted RNA binding protein YcfA (HicA-like mRNA interferase family)
VSKREKLRQKLRQQPAEADMQDVQTLLQRFGFTLVRTRGSHHIFEYDDGKRFQQIIIPLHGRRVKKVYVEKAVAILDVLFPIEAEISSEDENGEDT